MIISNEKGYTLIELIVVLAILGIMSAVILPKIHLIERYKLKSQAETLAEDIRYTQRLAMSENANYYFQIQKKENSYNIRSGNIKDKNVKKIYLSKDIKFTEESKSEIKYTSKGTPGMSGTIRLTSNNYRVEITIRPSSGRVTVYNITKNLINL